MSIGKAVYFFLICLLVFLINKQGRRNAAALTDQNVVGATCGLGVHHFKANVGFKKRRGEAGMKKADSLAGAEQHYFSGQLAKHAEIGFR